MKAVKRCGGSEQRRVYSADVANPCEARNFIQVCISVT